MNHGVEYPMEQKLVASPAGGNIAYKVGGTGQPLLLIHGTGCSSAVWRRLVGEYMTEFRVIAMDLRGAGLSASFDGADSDYFKTMVTDIIAVLDGAGAARAHLSGHSLGGALALGLALEAPHRVRSLQLHSTWAKSDAVLKRISFDPVIKAVESGDEGLLTGFGLGLVLSNEYLEAREPSTVHQLVDDVLLGRNGGATRSGLLAHLRAGRDHDVGDSIADVRVPTLVTFAERDLDIPRWYSEALLDRLPNADSHFFQGPRASHFALWEMEALFIAATKEFLGSLNNGFDHEI